MNLEEYISSGILEAYALGEVTDEERAEVEENLRRYPRLKEELARIEEVQEFFLMKNAIAPPARVKEKIMAGLDKPEIRLSVQRPEYSLRFWQIATAASVSLALISSYFAVDYRTQWTTTKSSLDALIAQNQKIAQDYNVVNQKLENIEQSLKVVNNPAFTRVVMAGTEGAPGSLASVYWNQNTSEVFLSIQNLKEIAATNQFQLWAIVDGKPVDAGLFDLTSDLIKMKAVKNASAFAVTIEPKGGNPSPTLSTMQVIGKI